MARVKPVAAWVLAVVAAIGAGVAVEAATEPQPQADVAALSPSTSSTSATSTNKPAPEPPCNAPTVDRVAEVPDLARTRFDCSKGWALVVDGEGGRGSFVLLDGVGSRWVRAAGGDLSELPFARLTSATTTLTSGISFGALKQLVAGLGRVVPAEIAAAILPIQLAARNAAADAAFMASPVTYTKRGEWLATGWYNAGCFVTIYRWSSSRWTPQGVVDRVPCHGPNVGGPGPAGGGITAEALTGASAPDFGVHTSGADDNASAVVSDIDGTWHLMRFDYGYTPTGDINLVAVRGHLVETIVNACGCAGGPYTYQWESYRDGMFEPISPPGPSPRCNNAALESGGGTAASQFGPARSPAIVRQTTYVRITCADGWALGIGHRTGSRRVLDLFSQEGARWQTVAFDNASDLGLDPGMYDIPYSLMLHLAARSGRALDAAADSGFVNMRLNPVANGGNWILSAVMNADRSNWLLATEYQSNYPQPGPELINVEIYRWSGTKWAVVGAIDGIHDGNNDFFADNAWYSVVSTYKSSTPTFLLTGTGNPPWTTKISQSDGTWHAI